MTLLDVSASDKPPTPVLQGQLESDPVSCAGLLRAASAAVAQWVACLHYGNPSVGTVCPFHPSLN